MTQARALELMLLGKNVFLTGPPGSGKSYVIEQFMSIAKVRGKTVALTATTGIAASLLSGVTVHSWLGLGVNNMDEQQLIADIMSTDIIVKRLQVADILIIDEISMMDGLLLEIINKLLKKARSSKLAFGGIQIILSGDFFQLPPVSRGLVKYAFDSQAWDELALVVCYLSGQHRQINDQLYEILTAMRERRLERRHLEALMDRQGVEHKDTTRLMTHNKEVDAINTERLAMLSSKEHSYQMEIVGRQQEASRLANTVLAPMDLKLKIGATVMFVANDFSQGFVNGSQGCVVSFKGGMPVVKLEANGKKIRVEGHSWKHTINKEVIAEVIQLPLRLAWAITIHKSQGMSLDEADIDLSRSFAYGMGYVALSRLRSYEGLYLRGINSRSLQLDNKIYEFDAKLRSVSEAVPISSKVDTKKSSDDLVELKAFVEAGINREFIKISLGMNNKQLAVALKGI
jgi:ATP-dependent exoDNAse (exonuclease V) alpha subunit